MTSWRGFSRAVCLLLYTQICPCWWWTSGFQGKSGLKIIQIVLCMSSFLWFSIAAKAVKTQWHGLTMWVYTQGSAKTKHLCQNQCHCKFFRYNKCYESFPTMWSNSAGMLLISAWFEITGLSFSSFGCSVSQACRAQPVCHSTVQTSWRALDFLISHMCVQRWTASDELISHKGQGSLAKRGQCSSR